MSDSLRKLRRTFRAVHRDMGFALSALLLAYSISGLAVNHIEDWNPNYRFDEEAIAIGALSGGLQDYQEQIVERLQIAPTRVKGHFAESDTEFRVFLTNSAEVRIDPSTGKGLFKTVKTRAGLYEINMLHLNSIKGVWTYVADLFAIMLILLILTGMFMTKGAYGLAGRGKWFLGVGLMVPLGFILFVVWGA